MMAKNASPVQVSDAEIDAAIAAAKIAREPRAVSVRYDEQNESVVIGFDNGNSLHIARANLQGLADATPDRLSDVVIEGPGTGLHWPQLDVDHYIPGLVQGVFGTRRWMAELGRAGGMTKSAAKAVAARNNGMLGGRPPSQNTATLSGSRSSGEYTPRGGTARSGLDARYRDSDGTILRKRGDTHVGTLRDKYGSEFAAGFRSDMKLETLLDRTGAASLSDYLKRNRR
jgi:hypothetical protein